MVEPRPTWYVGHKCGEILSRINLAKHADNSDALVWWIVRFQDEVSDRNATGRQIGEALGRLRRRIAANAPVQVVAALDSFIDGRDWNGLEEPYFFSSGFFTGYVPAGRDGMELLALRGWPGQPAWVKERHPEREAMEADDPCKG